MSLKKFILSLFVFFLFSNVFAQNKDSLSVITSKSSGGKLYYLMGIGYNFGAGVGSFSNTVENRDGSSTKEWINGSYGKGFDVFFGLGGKVSENLGFEIELGYLVGGRNKEKNQFYVADNVYPFVVKQDASYKANTFRVNPKILLEVPVHGGTFLYSKIGYLVGLGNAKTTYVEDWYFDNGGKGDGRFESTSSGGLVSGSTMALGFRFKTKEEGVSFFIEVSGNNLHRKFEKSTLTESIVNGQNTLSATDTYYKETIFVDKATEGVGAPNLNKAREYPSYRSSYSSAGLRLGFIKYF